MPALIITNLGGGDLSLLVISDKAWRCVLRLKKDPGFVEAVCQLTDAWVGALPRKFKPTDMILAHANVQCGVIAHAPHFEYAIKATLYLDP